jgi:NADPH2:quinone reductase
MQAILCNQHGTPDDLVLANIPEPTARAGEAVVTIDAVGLNFFDTLIIADKYQTKPALPFSPGGEFSGRIEAIGEGVAGFAPGDRVLGYCRYGAARERIAITQDRLVKCPTGLDADRAAGLTITYGTSYHALKDRAGLRPGETLAVLGASGGVGLAAVELGKLMGARVIACASTDDKLAFAREHGADEIVNYARDDLRAALKQLGGDHGIDVVYDPVGGRYTDAALRAVAWEGRVLIVGFAAGDIPQLPLNLVLLKCCDVRGVYWGEWVQRNPHSYRTDTEQLARWCADGKLSCHIDAAYPLADLPVALKAIAARQVKGKVVVRP